MLEEVHAILAAWAEVAASAVAAVSSAIFIFIIFDFVGVNNL
jgi:hypothetical protein